MRVLVAEDSEVDAELLRHALEHYGYDVTIANNGKQAWDLLRTGRYRLVVSDWEMPEMSGIDLCRAVRQHGRSYVYFILLTLKTSKQCVIEGLAAGADDYLTKPFEPEELYVRLRAGERLLTLESRDVAIFSLAKLAESRDPETGMHLERIREYCRILAEQLIQEKDFENQIDGEYAEMLYLTSPLHDIGKVGIPDRVLLKPGRLTPEEFEIMKQHTVIGGKTLDAAAMAYPEATYLRMARDIAWTHHEKFDGSGYPKGLRGREIPLCGRIVAVADVYDALTTKRVYKDAYCHEVARSIIVEGSNQHFDARIVDAFLSSENRILQTKERLEASSNAQENGCCPAVLNR